jgi:hypothetical protein
MKKLNEYRSDHLALLMIVLFMTGFFIGEMYYEGIVKQYNYYTCITRYYNFTIDYHNKSIGEMRKELEEFTLKYGVPEYGEIHSP